MESNTQTSSTPPSRQIEAGDQSLIDKAKSQAEAKVRSSVKSGTSVAAVALSTVAQSLMSSSQQLRDQQNPATGLLEQAADKLEQAAQSLESADMDTIVRRTETWARRNPALFLASAFLVGVAGARFLRSSSRGASSTPGTSGTGVGSGFSDRQVPTPLVEEV